MIVPKISVRRDVSEVWNEIKILKKIYSFFKINLILVHLRYTFIPTTRSDSHSPEFVQLNIISKQYTSKNMKLTFK